MGVKPATYPDSLGFFATCCEIESREDGVNEIAVYCCEASDEDWEKFGKRHSAFRNKIANKFRSHFLKDGCFEKHDRYGIWNDGNTWFQKLLDRNLDSLNSRIEESEASVSMSLRIFPPSHHCRNKLMQLVNDGEDEDGPPQQRQLFQKREALYGLLEFGKPHQDFWLCAYNILVDQENSKLDDNMHYVKLKYEGTVVSPALAVDWTGFD